MTVRVLFVCLGNICRSPLAMAIFDQKVIEAGLQTFLQSDSAGTSDFHIGELPDERTLKCASNHNTPLKHRGRQVNRTDFRDFDYIVAMDQNNLQNLESLKSQMGFGNKEIHLMRDFASGPKGLAVPDPYYGGPDNFEEVYQILDEAMEGFLNRLKATHAFFA
jgi:protein-tyrosine-phosphatase